MNVIEINKITKDYGNGKGVFDVSFSVEKGEVLGFLGPNGAGKTTTIRQLMGFIKPQKGTVLINGLSCFEDAAKIAKNLGYLPGEIAFMDDMSGNEFIKFIAEMKGIKDHSKAAELIELFELDPTGKIKKMSKGMKQKIGIVCAFMGDPEILILDEPTSGLDPLMQNKFVELIIAEKKKGKTILMSSHIFEEVEKTCDRAAIIRNGKIVMVEKIENLKKSKLKIIDITFENPQIAADFAEKIKDATAEDNKVTIKIKGDINPLIKVASGYDIKDLNIRVQTLEELFMHFYGGEE